jgi:uncharacterized protein (DUF433 family)
MATLDWSQCPAVESIPGKVSGAWVFKDTRMPVSLVFENLEAGATIDEITEWFQLTREQIVAVLGMRGAEPRPASTSIAVRGVSGACSSSLSNCMLGKGAMLVPDFLTS